MVLVSGSGSNLQAIIDAVAAGKLPAQVVAVGSDVPACGGIERAQRAGIPTFEVPLPRGASAEERTRWNTQLADQVLRHEPELVVSAGFMRILSEQFLQDVAVPVINTHPALLPSFPGAHAVRDALAAGVKITGCTVHQVDAGVDTGPIIAQAAVHVEPNDDVATLHERIKSSERRLLVEVLKAVAEGAVRLHQLPG